MADQSNNVIIGEEPINVVSDAQDEMVASAVEALANSAKDPNREIKKDNIEENIEKKRDFHAKLPNGKQPRMKASLYAIMTRKIRINGIKNPRIDTNDESFEAYLAKKVLHEGLKDINFPKLHKDIYKKYESEGTAFVTILKENGKLKGEVMSFFDFFFDPQGTELADEHLSNYDDNVKWIGFRRKLKRASFNKEFPDWADKVSSGSPLQERKNESKLTEEGALHTEWDMDEDVEIVYVFSLAKSDPVMLQIAGGSLTKMAEMRGADYEYRADNGNPVLPCVFFHFSEEKVGLMSASVVDFVKDGAEAIKKNLNHLLQNTSRIINAPTYIFGSADDSEIDEIVNYYDMQEAGFAPLIQRSDANVNIQSLAPADASSTYRNVKAEVYGDITERTGIMITKNDDNPDRKVGIFIRQDRDEGQAIKVIDDRNEDEFRRTAYLVYWFKKSMPMKKIKFNLGDGLGDLDISPAEVREVLKDYDPEWQVDTDMDMKLTFQEKVQARDAIARDLVMLMQSNIKPELAEPIAKSFYRKAVMLGMGKDYKESDFVNAAKTEGIQEMDPSLIQTSLNPGNVSNEPKFLDQVK